MRVLHVAATYLPAVRYGGTIVSVHGLCRALAARGHEVHVFTTNVDGPGELDVPLLAPVVMDGVRVWYFPSRFLRRLYFSRPMAQALAAQVGTFDLVHLHALFVWPAWAAARAARNARVPYLVSPRGMLEQRLIRKKSRVLKSLLLAAFGRRMLERAAALHVTSNREADEAAAFSYSLPPIHQVPNGVDLDGPPAEMSDLPPAIANLVNGAPYMVFVGRISWKKGLDRLIAALRHVPEIRLVIAGTDDEGYRGELEAQAAKGGVMARVVFCGPVHGEAKSALMARAQVLVLPSYSENFGNVVLEAMAAGCPVVVTPEVGIADIVQASGAGLVLDGAPEVLGSGLSRLLHDAVLRRAMGERGRAAASNYSWATVADRMERVYREVCS
ncbi:MAG: glycosyltransferase [Vicinamibacterales bacterium]